MIVIAFVRTYLFDGQYLERRSFDRTLNWDADLPRDLVERMWYDPHSLVAMGQILDDHPPRTVVRIEHPAGPFVFEYQRWAGFGRGLRKSRSRASAKTSWIDGRYLLAAGVPTPRPRACAERRLGPLGICSYLLTDFVAGIALDRFMQFAHPSAPVVRDLARQVGAIEQQLDELRISHDDLNAESLLVDLEGRLWLIDLETICRHRHHDNSLRTPSAAEMVGARPAQASRVPAAIAPRQFQSGV